MKDIDISVKFAAGIATRSIADHHWTVYLTVDAFPGGHVVMETDDKKEYRGNLDRIYNTGLIQGWTKGIAFGGYRNEDVYKLDEDDMEFLETVQYFIDFFQEGSMWLDVGKILRLSELQVAGPDADKIEAELNVTVP